MPVLAVVIQSEVERVVATITLATSNAEFLATRCMRLI
ncbi:hypothetical protein MJO28_011953 [Puccinia striiformis f. sp. tritici]|uniref:Uncharacterized protein n=1 Tax=Puccinia striiformis f. sp. tritici TaxID=168172 RepID=A0ACC0DZU1_9BASI|nr:hypothetical protein MJO28_011953 [Puccinia striiformis f. sp. tritici]